MKKVLVLHGPNINLTGIREPGTYGKQTLEQINKSIGQLAQQLGVACDIFQSNHEGELIDLLHRALTDYDGILLNAGAYTHYSYAIRGAKALRRGAYVQHPRAGSVPPRIGHRAGVRRTDLRLWRTKLSVGTARAGCSFVKQNLLQKQKEEQRFIWMCFGQTFC